MSEASPVRLDAHEEVCIVDEQNVVLGKADRIIMRQYILPHRSTYTIIQSKDGRFYVQKRSQLKDYFPGYLEPMAGGVVQYKETYEENAYRELEEEMGICNTSLTFNGIFDIQLENQQKTFGALYDCVYDGKLTLQKEEVDEVYLMTAEEILAQENECTPDSVYLLKEYLKIKEKEAQE